MLSVDGCGVRCFSVSENCVRCLGDGVRFLMDASPLIASKGK